MRTRAAGAAIGVGLIVALLVPFVLSSFAQDIATAMLVYAILAVALNLVVMQSGLLSLGHAAFFGIGAYAVALLAEVEVFNPVVVLVAAVLGATLVAAVLGPILLRTREEYFLMATLALGEVLRNIAISWRSVTGGDDGLYGPLRPTVLGMSLVEDVPFYYAVLVCLIVVTGLAWLLTRSAFGHTVRATRDNRRRVRALGIRATSVEYRMLLVSAAIAGFAGMLFAYSETFVSPSVFSLSVSGTVLLMVVLLNHASVFAAVAGAVVIEGLRGVGSHYTDRWMLLLGLVYIVVSLDVPRRLLGRRPAPLADAEVPESAGVPATAVRDAAP